MDSSGGSGIPGIVRVEDLCAVTKFGKESLLSLVSRAPSLYKYFVVGKVKKREIRPSIDPLKRFQRELATALDETGTYSRHAMGGITGRSILDHARPHVGKKLVATLDIRKCFPSTTPKMVKQSLMRIGVEDGLAGVITSLTTVDNQVPQGAPSSTAIINIVMIALDERLERICRENGLSYTRYVDDIAISGNWSFQGLRPELIAAIEALEYGVSTEKVHFMSDGERQIVTGLVVNDHLRPTTDWIRELKRLIRRTWSDDLERLSAECETRDPYRLHLRIRGRVQHLVRVCPKIGKEVQRLTYRTRWPWQVRDDAGDAVSSSSVQPLQTC